MFEYTIAAIPTVYNGVKYRSRLEARWAAFFDLLGWRHTYEPYDMGAWSPDFLISLKSELSSSMLVEVKPISQRCDETIRKMTLACRERGFFSPEGSLTPPEESPITAALLVGICPVPTSPKPGCVTNHHLWDVQIGWVINDGGITSEVGIYWSADFDSPVMVADIGHVDRRYQGYWTVMGGDGATWMDPHDPPPVKSYAVYTMALWAQACNTVQWLGAGKGPS